MKFFERFFHKEKQQPIHAGWFYRHWCGCETFRRKDYLIMFSKKCGNNTGENTFNISHYEWIAAQHPGAIRPIRRNRR